MAIGACGLLVLAESLLCHAGGREIRRPWCGSALGFHPWPPAAAAGDGRRIEGNQASTCGDRSGVTIATRAPPRREARHRGGRVWPRSRPRSPILCWNSHNGDRMRGRSAATQRLRPSTAGVLLARCWWSFRRIPANPLKSRLPSKPIGCGGSCSMRPSSRGIVRHARSSAATVA